MENKQIQKLESTGLNVFSSAENFELAQRVAKSLASSDLVPKEYRNNIPNTLIALEMASRIGTSPLMVMQHLDIIYGRPSWRSTFLISAINSSGKFDSLRFNISGSGDSLACIAWTTDKKGNKLEGPAVTMEMAKKEGWYSKNGSKWQTMPELMIRYRSAAFFARLYCPEITMGMQTAEEVIDITYEEIPKKTPAPDALSFEKDQQKTKKENNEKINPETGELFQDK